MINVKEVVSQTNNVSLQNFYKGRLGTIAINSGVSFKIFYFCIICPVLVYTVTINNYNIRQVNNDQLQSYENKIKVFGLIEAA